jgi:hypothetical protein
VRGQGSRAADQECLSDLPANLQLKLLRWRHRINHEGFRTVRENVIIAYRGTNYELGQWPQGYGIWTAGASHSQPNEWWPGTPEGWSAAWYRFVAIEVPGTIVQVSPPVAVPADQPRPQAGRPAGGDVAQPAGPPNLQPFILPAGQPHVAAGGQPQVAASGQPYVAQAGQPYLAQPQATQPYTAQGQGHPAPGYSTWGQPHGPAQALRGSRGPAASATWRNPVAVGLLIFGLVCGVIGLFPKYIEGSSLASSSVDLVPHVIYLVAWAVAAVLIGTGGTRQRTGALLGLGVSVVTFGLFFADAGWPLAHGAHAAKMGAGLILGLVGWLGCAAGSGLAFGRWPFDWPRELRSGREIGFAAALIAAGVGAAITFAPSWDRYVVTTVSASQTMTEGNAFANPGPVIVGNVAVMVAVVAVLVAAALWRPARIGWALAAGAIIPLVAQLISAAVEMAQPALTQLGITKSDASTLGLTGSSASFTGWFWAYCAFVVVLVLMCAWLAARPDRSMTAAPLYPGPAAGWPGVTAAAGPGMTAPAGPGSQPPAGGQASAGAPADPAPAYPTQPQDGTAGWGSS